MRTGVFAATAPPGPSIVTSVSTSIAIAGDLSECEGEWESLSARDRARVTMVARAVVRRMLHEPTMRLQRAGGDGDGAPHARAVRDLFSSAPAEMS